MPAAELSVPAGSWIRVADAEIGPGRAEGSVDTEALTAAWSLTFEGDDRALQVPAGRLALRGAAAADQVRRAVARRPLRGPPELDDEPLELAGWPGMIGHNWGTEHAERWVWLEGTGFPDAPGTYFDAGAARVQPRPPHQPLDPLRDADARRRAAPARRPRRDPRRGSRSRPTVCQLRSSPARTSSSTAASPPREKDFVGWVYADPDGPEHNTVNCSVADLELTVERPGRPPRELTLAAGGAYELGMRETDHGIPIQPYPDG